MSDAIRDQTAGVLRDGTQAIGDEAQASHGRAQAGATALPCSVDIALGNARRMLWASLIAGVAISLVFVGFPQLDIAVSRLFIPPPHLAGFPLLHDHRAFEFVELLRIASRLVAVLSIAWMLVALARRAPAWFLPCIIAVSLMLGPGLLVSEVLKNHWGRARPKDIVEFGGPMHFTPAWVISDQCLWNCSFTSGDAAVGFSPLVGCAVDRRRRWWWLAIGMGLGLGVGLLRMAMGGHFLSDVLLSGVIVSIVASAVACVVLGLVRRRGLSSRVLERGPGA